MAGMSEPHAEGEFGASGEVDLCGERNIAVQRRVISPVHPKIVGEIGPAIIHPDIAAGKTRKWQGCRDRQVGKVAVRHEESAPSCFRHLTIVVHASNLEMGSTKYVQMQLPLPRWIHVEA